MQMASHVWRKAEWRPQDPRPALFMVHGMLASHRQWIRHLDRLWPHVRPVMVDLWGHGDSPAPEDDAAYHMGSAIEQFDRIRENLGIERWLLCGHSFGACFSLRYAIEKPERVLGQIFTNSLSGLSPPGTLGSDEERAQRAADLMSRGIEAIREMRFHPSKASRLPQEVYDDLVAVADRTNPQALARITRITSAELTVHPDLERIQCPSLLLNGQWERAFQPLRDEAASRIADIDVVDLPAGHSVNLEQGEIFERELLAWLNRRNLAP
ncbi:MAG: alpha/beta fold hydrolase [Burkholderiales bacterium]|jgi:pimeloyl-ACP methyl ester carboxylesterase